MYAVCPGGVIFAKRVAAPLVKSMVGWPLGMFALGVWAIYRVARGWLRLNAMQTMPV